MARVESQHRNSSAEAIQRDLVRPGREANEWAIRRQVEQDHIVGLIDANYPDFEFANFSLDELIEIAALMDEHLGFKGGKVRSADWKGTDRADAFAARYRKFSARRCALKGKVWGEALAAYAIEHPVHPQIGTKRPFLRTVSAAVWAWTSNYSFRTENFTFDLKTFEEKRR